MDPNEKTLIEYFIKQCYKNEAQNSILNDISILIISCIVLLASGLNTIHVINIDLPVISLFNIGVIFHALAIVFTLISFQICNKAIVSVSERYMNYYVNDKPLSKEAIGWEKYDRLINTISTILFLIGFVCISIFFIINI